MHLIKMFSEEQEIEHEYHVSSYIIAYKFFLGVIEFAAGVAVAFYGSSLYQLYQASVIKELSEDPHDVLARLSEIIVPNVLTHHGYVVISLIVLGVAKMVGAIGLIYKQNWGVDLLVSLTVILAPFQIINLILHPHIVDVIYFVVGLLIALYLIQFKPKAWISRVLLQRGPRSKVEG